MKATWRTTADEPASAALRRLHEEAHEHEVLSSRGERARRTLDAALPALADLVKWTEDRASESCHWQPMHEHGEEPDTCVACGARRALAALRERLEARP